MANFHAGQGRTVVCRFNPRDCVSVPRDYNAQKVRVCKYEVVEDYKGEPFENTLHVFSSYDEQETEDDESEDQNDEETYFFTLGGSGGPTTDTATTSTTQETGFADSPPSRMLGFKDD